MIKINSWGTTISHSTIYSNLIISYVTDNIFFCKQTINQKDLSHEEQECAEMFS